MARAQHYIPPLSYDWLTPLYDRLIPLAMPEAALKRRLIEQAHVSGGQRVLDIGAGTATLTIMIKQAHPDADIIGMDGDPRVLAIGWAKAAAAGVQLRLDHGFATHLPYDESSFERVFSSLMLHHLNAEDKRLAFAEVWRVLRPGGEVHILDFGKPHTVPTYLISLVMRHAEQTVDNIRGRLPEIMREAGFVQVEETVRCATLLGTLSLYRGRKPA
jgi:ubiquinone/menaquinone biosynthesis C-methylase UbiE